MGEAPVIQVSAPTRLHFGLLHVPVPGTPLPHFGGLGAMLDSPRVEVSVQASNQWSITGSLAARAQEFAKHISAVLRNSQPLTIIADGPMEHTGLGVGTALGMALARAMANASGLGDLSNDEIATVSGRGKRSQIGVHGFETGGFLFDQGHGRSTIRVEFPTSWCFALITPEGDSHWHGEPERAAFARTRPLADAVATTQKLQILIEDRLRPALASQDFAPFAAALGDYNRIAGEPFASDQGGSYSNPQSARIIDDLRAAGFHGVGQSSWGPTIFVLLENESDLSRIGTTSATLTHVAAKGAVIQERRG